MRSRWLVVAVVLSYLVMLFGGGLLKPGYSHIGQVEVRGLLQRLAESAVYGALCISAWRLLGRGNFSGPC